MNPLIHCIPDNLNFNSPSNSTDTAIVRITSSSSDISIFTSELAWSHDRAVIYEIKNKIKKNKFEIENIMKYKIKIESETISEKCGIQNEQRKASRYKCERD